MDMVGATATTISQTSAGVSIFSRSTEFMNGRPGLVNAARLMAARSARDHHSMA
jgi:hypothetical protein